MEKYISIVGRTNVGKSLLFNKLIKTKKSLVLDEHGITRDFNAGLLFLDDRAVKIYDTAGISYTEGSLSNKIQIKTKQLLINSTIIIFVVSIKEGLTDHDLIICETLRKLNKKIYLVINN